jgi:hypothetical protein
MFLKKNALVYWVCTRNVLPPQSEKDFRAALEIPGCQPNPHGGNLSSQVLFREFFCLRNQTLF